MTTVLVVDAHHTYADALKIAIDSDPHLHCVGIGHSTGEALVLVRSNVPDRSLVNLDPPDADALGTIRLLHEAAPDMALVALASRVDLETLRATEAAGADYFIPQQSSIRDVLDTLRAPRSRDHMVLAGAVVVDLNQRRVHASEVRDPDRLTAREVLVLRGMADGAAPKVIAARMQISVHTVRGHVKNIYWKLGAHNQLEAVAIARRRGLVTDVS